MGGPRASGVPRRVRGDRRPRADPGRPGRDRAAADDLRAGEGGVRAALRAEQSTRLDRDSRRGDPAHARRGAGVTTGLDLYNPHGFLGAHPAKGGVVVRTYRPEAERVTVRP